MIQPNKLVLPVAAWAVLQLILLGIGASGFPLWAHQPAPPESLSLPILLCGQILICSMLFPVLAESGWMVGINLAIMLPFDELGGLLSNTSQALIAKSWICVGLWFLGLSFWRKYRLVGTLAVLFTAGGIVLDYLRWEQFSSDGRPAEFHPVTLLGNICLDCGWMGWMEAAIPLVAAVPLLVWWRKVSSPLHPTEPN